MAFPNYPKADDEGLPNGFASSRGGAKIRYVVVHVAAGFYEGTIAWFNDRRAQANSHYLVGKLPGQLCQFVDEKWAAWHSYPANEESIGIEHADDLKNGSPGWMSAWQFEASAQLTAYLLKKYGLGVSAIVRHNDVGNTDHNCPGPHFPMDRYKKRVSEILKGASGTPTKAPLKPDKEEDVGGDLYRVVVGQGEKDLKLARKRGFDKAWMLGQRVIVGSGHRGFAEETKDRAIAKGFNDAWLLEVDPDAPEMATKPDPEKEEALPDEVPRWKRNWEVARTYGRNCASADILYWFWDGGMLNRSVSGRPASEDGPAPRISGIRRGFCADLVTWMMRRTGLPIPKNRGAGWNYDGGTQAFWLAYKDVMVPFTLSEMRDGDAAFRRFRDGVDEGHIMVDDEGMALQSIALDNLGNPGPNRRYTVAESHDGGYYEYRIPREELWA